MLTLAARLLWALGSCTGIVIVCQLLVLALYPILSPRRISAGGLFVPSVSKCSTFLCPSRRIEWAALIEALFLGLAVSSLVADALFHLLPEALLSTTASFAGSFRRPSVIELGFWGIAGACLVVVVETLVHSHQSIWLFLGRACGRRPIDVEASSRSTVVCGERAAGQGSIELRTRDASECYHENHRRHHGQVAIAAPIVVKVHHRHQRPPPSPSSANKSTEDTSGSDCVHHRPQQQGHSHGHCHHGLMNLFLSDADDGDENNCMRQCSHHQTVSEQPQQHHVPTDFHSRIQTEGRRRRRGQAQVTNLLLRKGRVQQNQLRWSRYSGQRKQKRRRRTAPLLTGEASACSSALASSDNSPKLDDRTEGGSTDESHLCSRINSATSFLDHGGEGVFHPQQQHSASYEIDPRDRLLRSTAWANLVAECLHNFVDGLAIGTAFSSGPIRIGIATSIAIFAHEVPSQIADFVILLRGRVSPWVAFALNFAVAFGIHLGSIAALLGTPEAFRSQFQMLAGTNFLCLGLSMLLPQLRELLESSFLLSSQASARPGTPACLKAQKWQSRRVCSAAALGLIGGVALISLIAAHH